MKTFIQNKYLLYLLISIVTASTQSCSSEKQKTENLVQFVDPYIGTAEHGHVFLGAHVPFGAVQVGPTNYIKGWDWCSGYHYSDSIITGFAQTHLSGTGIGDLGDVLITPYLGAIKTSPGTKEDPLAGYASKYTHTQETAKAGYYSVELLRDHIKAEFSATERTAFHQYTFPKSDSAHIAINLTLGIGWDRISKSSFTLLNDSTIVGYRFSKGWAPNQSLYFAIRTSSPITNFKIFDNNRLVQATEVASDSLVGILSFATSEQEIVQLKVGISPVSSINAIDNINKENPQWNFPNMVAKAQSKWNDELSKIRIESKDSSQLRTFYTAMYHAYTAPVLFNDANGDYRGTDKKIYKDASFNNYSIFSLWDTYRAEHPLFTLTQSAKVSDMVNSMLAIYQQQGKLPIWALLGNETDCMVGYSAVPVVADAIFKGIKNIDKNLALEAMIASSMRDDYGVKYLKELGYIPCNLEKESVAKALEYAISDWCIAQLAGSLNDTVNANYYSERAQAYTQYFDKETHFMRAIDDKGNYRFPFSPFSSTHIWGDYTEGNAWQYTWLVPHDVEGLIHLFGSEESFTNKLDSLFIVSGDLGSEASPDISGLIGMYAHGNEPGHHIPYLYAFAGQQWKTAKLVRQILTEMYSDQPDGICGNEDCGQMSAWYILSSMGFYQVNPANGIFVLGSPLFEKASLQLENGKTFTIIANNQSIDHPYIQSAKLNGKNYTKSFITYQDIIQGGTLELTMSETPNKEFGALPINRPTSKPAY